MIDQDVLVSVVIPTYSRNDSLCVAIDSVLEQTYQNLEIIIIDDNPEDSAWRKSTETLMAKYATDPRIRYLKNKENLGGAGARNEGIKAAKGEYIAFLDDDDIYFKERIENQLECFLNNQSEKLALVFCDALMTGDDDVFICYMRPHYRGCCLYDAMKYNCLAPTSQWMAKKSALISVGMFSIVPCKQDSTLILKLLSNGYEVDHVPKVLSQFRNSSDPGRITCSGTKNIKGELLYRKKCRELYSLFNEKQIKEIEFTFNSILYRLYNGTTMISEKRKYRKAMIQAFPLRSVYKIAHERASSIKWRIKKRIQYYSPPSFLDKQRKA